MVTALRGLRALVCCALLRRAGGTPRHLRGTATAAVRVDDSGETPQWMAPRNLQACRGEAPAGECNVNCQCYNNDCGRCTANCNCFGVCAMPRCSANCHCNGAVCGSEELCRGNPGPAPPRPTRRPTPRPTRLREDGEACDRGAVCRSGRCHVGSCSSGLEWQTCTTNAHCVDGLECVRSACRARSARPTRRPTSPRPTNRPTPGDVMRDYPVVLRLYDLPVDYRLPAAVRASVLGCARKHLQLELADGEPPLRVLWLSGAGYLPGYPHHLPLQVRLRSAPDVADFGEGFLLDAFRYDASLHRCLRRLAPGDPEWPRAFIPVRLDADTYDPADAVDETGDPTPRPTRRPVDVAAFNVAIVTGPPTGRPTGPPTPAPVATQRVLLELDNVEDAYVIPPAIRAAVIAFVKDFLNKHLQEGSRRRLREVRREMRRAARPGPPRDDPRASHERRRDGGGRRLQEGRLEVVGVEWPGYLRDEPYALPLEIATRGPADLSGLELGMLLAEFRDHAPELNEFLRTLDGSCGTGWFCGGGKGCLDCRGEEIRRPADCDNLTGVPPGAVADCAATCPDLDACEGGDDPRCELSSPKEAAPSFCDFQLDGGNPLANVEVRVGDYDPGNVTSTARAVTTQQVLLFLLDVEDTYSIPPSVWRDIYQFIKDFLNKRLQERSNRDPQEGRLEVLDVERPGPVRGAPHALPLRITTEVPNDLAGVMLSLILQEISDHGNDLVQYLMQLEEPKRDGGDPFRIVKLRAQVYGAPDIVNTGSPVASPAVDVMETRSVSEIYDIEDSGGVPWWVWLLVAFGVLACCGCLVCLWCLQCRKKNTTENMGTTEMNVLVEAPPRDGPRRMAPRQRATRFSQSINQTLAKAVPKKVREVPQKVREVPPRYRNSMLLSMVVPRAKPKHNQEESLIQKVKSKRDVELAKEEEDEADPQPTPRCRNSMLMSMVMPRAKPKHNQEESLIQKGKSKRDVELAKEEEDKADPQALVVFDPALPQRKKDKKKKQRKRRNNANSDSSSSDSSSSDDSNSDSSDDSDDDRKTKKKHSKNKQSSRPALLAIEAEKKSQRTTKKKKMRDESKSSSSDGEKVRKKQPKGKQSSRPPPRQIKNGGRVPTLADKLKQSVIWMAGSHLEGADGSNQKKRRGYDSDSSHSDSSSNSDDSYNNRKTTKTRHKNKPSSRREVLAIEAEKQSLRKTKKKRRDDGKSSSSDDDQKMRKKQSKKSQSSRQAHTTESKRKSANGARRKSQDPPCQSTLGDRLKSSLIWIAGKDLDGQRDAIERSSRNKRSKDGIEPDGYTGEDEEARRKAREKRKKEKKKREAHSKLEDSNTDDGGNNRKAKDGNKNCRALVAIEPEGHTTDEAQREARRQRKKKKKAKKERGEKRPSLVEDLGGEAASRNKGGVDSEEDNDSCATRSH